MESCYRFTGFNEGCNSTLFEGANGQLGEFALHTRRMNSLMGVSGNPGNSGNCSESAGTHECVMVAIVFSSLAVISLMIAGAFAMLGAWLILPFAGLEAVALYLTYGWITRHARDSELLTISGNAVALVVCEGQQTQRHEFNRAWARLVVEQRGWHTRLALRSQGREVEVGRYLDGDGRQRLARELRARLRGG